VVDGIPELKTLSSANVRHLLQSERSVELLYWCLKKPNFILKLCDKDKVIVKLVYYHFGCFLN